MRFAAFPLLLLLALVARSPGLPTSQHTERELLAETQPEEQEPEADITTTDATDIEDRRFLGAFPPGYLEEEKARERGFMVEKGFAGQKYVKQGHGYQQQHRFPQQSGYQSYNPYAPAVSKPAQIKYGGTRTHTFISAPSPSYGPPLKNYRHVSPSYISLPQTYGPPPHGAPSQSYRYNGNGFSFNGGGFQQNYRGSYPEAGAGLEQPYLGTDVYVGAENQFW